jgi:hypothetical protein
MLRFDARKIRRDRHANDDHRGGRRRQRHPGFWVGWTTKPLP